MLVHLSLLLVALLGGLLPTFANNGHPLERRLSDILGTMQNRADITDDLELIELLTELISSILITAPGLLGDEEPPTEEQMTEMVAGITGAIPQELLQYEEALKCLFLSIVAEPIQYVPLPPRAAYEDNKVCLDNSCDKGTKEIKFVDKDPKDEEFLYASSSSGIPEIFQGVFWLNYGGPCSTMVSFGETNENYPIATGDFLDNPLPFGFDYYIRVLGASNWAYSTGPDNLLSCYNLVSAIDLIYGFRMVDGAFPPRLQIVPNIKLPSTCIRANIDTCGSDMVLLQFDMVLVEDCSTIPNPNPDNRLDPNNAAFEACDAGAVVWQRETWVLEDTMNPPSIYYVIQIVDGEGEKLSPSYDDFVSQETTTEGDAVNYFRSLEKKGEEKFCGTKPDLPMFGSKKSAKSKPSMQPSSEPSFSAAPSGIPSLSYEPSFSAAPTSSGKRGKGSTKVPTAKKTAVVMPIP